MIPAIPNRTAFPAILAFAALLAACGSGSGRRPGSGAPRGGPVSDTIVQMAGEARYPLGGRLVEEVAIGDSTQGEAYRFTVAGDLLLDRDGRVWVLEAGSRGTNTASITPSLRVFDGAGRFLRRIDARGSSAVRFEYPRGLGQLPDGRVLLREDGRVAVYSSEGELGEMWIFQAQYNCRMGASSDCLRVDRTGTVWLGNGTSTQPVPTIFFGPGVTPVAATQLPARPGSGLVRVDRGGRVIDTVPFPLPPPTPTASISVTESTVSARGRSGSTRFIQLPFAAVSGWAWHPDGYFATWISDRYAIDLQRPQRTGEVTTLGVPGPPPPWRPGDPIHSIRRPVSPDSITGGERDSLRRELERRVSGAPGRRSAPMPAIPRTKPLINALHFGLDGQLWVGVGAATNPAFPTTSPPAARPFDVFDPSGAYLGRVIVPRAMVLSAIRGDEIWCVDRERDRAPRLVKYRLVWN